MCKELTADRSLSSKNRIYKPYAYTRIYSTTNKLLHFIFMKSWFQVMRNCATNTHGHHNMMYDLMAGTKKEVSHYLWNIYGLLFLNKIPHWHQWEKSTLVAAIRPTKLHSNPLFAIMIFFMSIIYTDIYKRSMGMCMKIMYKPIIAFYMMH